MHADASARGEMHDYYAGPVGMGAWAMGSQQPDAKGALAVPPCLRARDRDRTDHIWTFGASEVQRVAS